MERTKNAPKKRVNPTFPRVASLQCNEDSSPSSPLLNVGKQWYQEQQKTRKITIKKRISPLRIAVVCLWVVAVMGLLTIDIITDLYQGSETKNVGATAKRPHEQSNVELPFGVFFGMNVALNAIASFLVFLLGYSTKKNFAFLQPFVGGQKFVLMQATAYILGVLCIVVRFILLELKSSTFNVGTYYGAFSILGCFNTFAQLLLLSSIHYFDSDSAVESSGSNEGSINKNTFSLSLSTTFRHKKVAFIIMSNFVIAFCSVVAEFYVHFRRVNLFVMLALMSTSLISLESLSSQLNFGHFFLPRMETFKLFMSQCLANGSVVLGYLACLGALHVGPDVGRGWQIICAVLSIMGISLHLIVLRLRVNYWRIRKGIENSDHHNSFLGPIMASSLNSLLIFTNFVVFYFSRSANWEYFGWSDRVRDNIRALTELHVLIAALFLLFPPLTHYQGKLIHGVSFKIWQPFTGSTEFVALQTTGWAAYGSIIFFVILSLNAEGDLQSFFILIYSSAAFLSQVCIHSSLYFYTSPSSEKETVHTETGNVSTASTSDSSGEFEGDLLDLLSDKEILLAILLSGLSIVIRLVCDGAIYFQFGDLLKRSPLVLQNAIAQNITLCALVMASTFFCFSSSVMAQISCWKRFKPFTSKSSSGGYVSLQTFGWTLYVVIFILTLYLKLSKDVISVAALYVLDENYMFWLTGEGMIELVPFFCVLVSIFFEMEAQESDRASFRRIENVVYQFDQIIQKKQLSETEEEIYNSLLVSLASRFPSAAYAFSENEENENDSHSPLRSSLETKGNHKEDDALSETAKIVSSIIGMVCLMMFIGGSLLSTTQPTVSLFLIFLGIMFLTISCLSLHVMYGGQLHRGKGRYHFFMPFTGGRTFCIFQSLGWSAYTLCFLIFLAVLVEGKPSPFVCSSLCVLSVFSQLCVLYSIPLFNENEILFEEGFVGRNVEGILASFIVVGTFFFVRGYEAAYEGRMTEETTSLLMMFVVSLSTVIVVPMGLLYLKRQSKFYGVSSLSFFEGLEDNTEDPSVPSSRASLAKTPLAPPMSPHSPSKSIRAGPENSTLWTDEDLAIERQMLGGIGRTNSHYARLTSRSVATLLSITILFAVFLVLLLPFVGVLWMYTLQHKEDIKLDYDFVSNVLELFVFLFLLLILIPMIILPVLNKTKFLRGVHDAISTFLIYSIPTITVLSGLSPPFLFPTWGARLFGFNMCSMALLSTVPYVHLTAFVFSVISAAYFSQYHLYTCLYQARYPFQFFVCVTDILCSLFWIWYDGRYSGRPEITCRLYSIKATRIFKNYFFQSLARYFSLKVVLSSNMTLPREKLPMSADRKDRTAHVDMRNPENQYMFSFHPHGVFPGTAIYGPRTKLWDATVGSNEKTKVTTHCADIVFSVPLMREFPLVLGAMSVSRKGIERSIANGDSPLIVTGGQSEMLLTAVSDTEMHLVLHHLGFIRLAMKHKIPLVPVLSFAESNILNNVHCLKVQRWFLNLIAFPFPTLPIGRWGLPLPRKTPMTLVIGQPLLPLTGREDPEDSSCVEEMRLRYFEHLEVLFYKYREEAGYPNMKLFLHNGIYNSGVQAMPPTANPDGSIPEDAWFKDVPSAACRALQEKEETEKKGKIEKAKKE